ncbi:MAG: cyclic pyranopterin monophosphate synthase MoaC [Magnetococcales bacterium]|nr:cyclic pyranopterin monophosphate synthase MoaC [Magnetococcales bacterium]NGZ26606.1 cyclic pyranopterin monophosphate synthase MoaC [Magnetococcales bacterium]
MPDTLTHFDTHGASHMVDVSAKEITHRLAVAEGWVAMQPTTLRLILNRQLAKGDVLEVARLAGIMASKRVDMLIPLCHAIALDSAAIAFQTDEEHGRVHIQATVKTSGRTGVEMEALTAVAVTGLTIYDMCKAVDRAMEIGPIRLVEKAGGRSGHFIRQQTD